MILAALIVLGTFLAVFLISALFLRFPAKKEEKHEDKALKCLECGCTVINWGGLLCVLCYRNLIALNAEMLDRLKVVKTCIDKGLVGHHEGVCGCIVCLTAKTIDKAEEAIGEYNLEPGVSDELAEARHDALVALEAMREARRKAEATEAVLAAADRAVKRAKAKVNEQKERGAR